MGSYVSAEMDPVQDAEPAFLKGGGEVATLIAARDWSASLGPIPTWSASLKSAVGLIVRSGVPMALLWGPDGIMLYNDAYAALTVRRPQLLGSKVREAWPELAEFNDQVMKVALAGGTLAYKDQELVVHYPGGSAQAWFNLDYSPVFDETGEPVGVIAVVVDTTERVLAERRQAALSTRLQRQFEQAPGFVIVMTGPEYVVEFVNETHRRMFGSEDWIGKPIQRAFPSLKGQGFFEALRRTYLTGEPVQYEALETRYRRGPDSPIQVRYLSFVYAPILDDGGHVAGVFCNGFDVTETRWASVRRDALARLTDQLQDLDDTAEISSCAASILGETLQLSRAGYGVIDADDVLHVDRDWAAPGVEHLAGATRLDAYGAIVENLRRHEIVAISDVRDDDRTRARAHILEARGVRALVDVPVIEYGRMVAMLYVNASSPRSWDPEDIALLREMAARTRTAVERARGQIALRENEARLRFLDTLARGTASSEDADTILAITTRMVGEYLGASLCAYADLDQDGRGITVRGDWAAPGSRSIVGHYSLTETDKLLIDKLASGQPLIVNDSLAELTPAEAARIQDIGMSAAICIPLVKEGRLAALMSIHDKAPHAWSANELAVLRDVAERSWAHIERVRGQAELRASEANFRSLASALPTQVWTAKADGQLSWLNEQAYLYTGAEPNSLEGSGWAGVIHPDDLPHSRPLWERAVETGATYEAEFRVRRRDGAYRWHLARAVATTDNHGQVVRWIGANTDIQDQREAAETLANLNATLEQRVAERTRQLNQTQDALRQAQKMEAVGQLTGGIAHDFNNLLTAISGSLELMERRISQGRLNSIDRYMDAAQQASRRAASLTQRLLAFSRRQTLDPRPIDVNRLVGGMEDLIRRSVGPDVAVEVAGDGDVWTTRVDPGQLENALLNLCINARDAMSPDGGLMIIATANMWLEEPCAAECDLPPGEYVALSVTDTGVGMCPEVISRAFDPFYTTKPLGVGTGLGLSMVYGFARQSGGQVRINSEVGKGTTVRLYLPRFHGAAEVQELAAPSGMRAGDGEVVLVVDDETTVRQLIVEVLTENGYTAMEAGDGPSALRVLESDARIDLLVTDVGLPGGMNGRQVADAARVSRPDLKVLFITGYAENAVVGDGHLDPGMEVVTKPFVIAALGARIRTLIEH